MKSSFLLALFAALVCGCAISPCCSDAPEQSRSNVVCRAVVAGLDHVDAKKWNGWDGDCPGTLLDAARKRAQLEALRYDRVTPLINAAATKYGIVAAGIAAAEGLRPDDLLYVFVSGHGGQNPDATGEEPDQKDEYLCLYDGPLLDDTIWQLLCRVPAGVRVVLQFDTCNSRTMYRGVGRNEPHDYAAGVRRRSMDARSTGPGFSGRLLCVAGCNDGASGYGNAQSGGNMTAADVRAFKAAGQTYAQWFEAFRALMPKYQTPYFSEVGESFAHYPALR